MVSRSWTASGTRSASTHSDVSGRPLGSWGEAVDRARRSWDGLTGGPGVGLGGLPSVRYSEAAAAAILRTALGLWTDVAAGMAAGEGSR